MYITRQCYLDGILKMHPDNCRISCRHWGTVNQFNFAKQNSMQKNMHGDNIAKFRTHENKFCYSMFQGQLSHIVRKPDFCLCENKGAHQLRNNCEADQHLCVRYTDSAISLLLKSEISSFEPATMTAQVGLCQT